jgi:tetratricopeptide (TPR) repeat protein
MKKIIFFFLLISNLVFGQTIPLKIPNQESEIEVKGNSNIIRVIQGGVVNIYDLTSGKSVTKFLNYLKTIPSIAKEIKKIFKTTQHIDSITTETNALVKALIAKNSNEGILDTDKLKEKLDTYIKENESLKIENERLKRETTDLEFAKVLEEANKKLDEYDNEGYQKVLGNYKKSKKNKLENELRELSSVSYLQAKNNESNYKYEEALLQIDEALSYDVNNISYLSFKADVLGKLFLVNESINIYLKLLKLDMNDTSRSATFHNIALAFKENGIFDKALEYYMQAIYIQKGIYSEIHPSVSLSYTNISLVYLEKDNFDSAIEYATKALVIQEKLSELDTNAIANCYNNLGLIYDSRGTFKKAFYFFNKALILREKKGGIANSEIAVSYSNIGSAYQKIQNYEQAKKYIEKALKTCISIYGVNHPTTAFNYVKIGNIYGDKGEYKKALENYNKAFLIQKKIYDQYHRYVGDIYGCFGKTYSDMGNYTKALEYYFSAVNCQIKIYGVNHHLTADLYTSISNAYCHKDDYKNALEYAFNSLNIYKKIFGEDDFNSGWALNQIGLIYHQMENYDKALFYYNQAIIIFDKKIGKENPEIASVFSNIGQIYQVKGEDDKGLEYMNRALAIEKKIFGEFHPSTALTYQNIAYANYIKGDYDAALRNYDRVLLLHQKIFNDENDITKKKKSNSIYQVLGLIFISMGDKEKGLSYWGKTDFAKVSKYAKANVMNDFALEKFNKNKYAEAINFFEIALDILGTNISDKNDSKRIIIYSNLALANCNIGNKTIAISQFEKALALNKLNTNTILNIEYIKKNYENCKSK